MPSTKQEYLKNDGSANGDCYGTDNDTGDKNVVLIEMVIAMVMLMVMVMMIAVVIVIAIGNGDSSGNDDSTVNEK